MSLARVPKEFTTEMSFAFHCGACHVLRESRCGAFLDTETNHFICEECAHARTVPDVRWTAEQHQPPAGDA